MLAESGYLLLVKLFTDDLAWKVQRQLVNGYFKAIGRGNINIGPETLIPSEQQTLSEIVHKRAEVYGEPWFVGKDIGAALGYADEADAINQHCKHHKPLNKLNSGKIPESISPRLLMIQEPDVYRLIVKSKLPSAEKFESWVFEEVLPAIRKSGSYSQRSSAPPALSPVSREFKAALSLAKAIGFKGNQAVLSANKAIRKRMGVDCLELLEATHLIADSQDPLLTVTELAQRTGIPVRLTNSSRFISIY